MVYLNIVIKFNSINMEIKNQYLVDYTWLSPKIISDRKYDLLNPNERKIFFNKFLGKEIENIRAYMKSKTFICYAMSPKMAGKGTFLGLLGEIVGQQYFTTISVGDLFRKADEDYRQNGKDSETYKYIVKNHRGYSKPEDLADSLINRSTKTVSPTELALILLKKEIDKLTHQSIFIDGFPRTVDQVSYSLYMRDLIGYRNDPDYFMFINVPIKLIDIRIKDRRVCPKCGNSKNLTTNPSSICDIDKNTNETIMYCDKPNCTKEIMVPKEGDNLGVQNIADRIEADLELIGMARNLYGIPKIEVFNSIPVSEVEKYLNDFEVTKEYYFEKEHGKIVRKEKDLIFEENGEKYVSLLPSANVVQIMRQINQFVQ